MTTWVLTWGIVFGTCMFHHNAYACKWIGHMNGEFHSFHMYIHERSNWSFHKQYLVRKNVILMKKKNPNKLEHLKYMCMRVHEEIEWSGKVQWDPN